MATGAPPSLVNNMANSIESLGRALVSMEQVLELLSQDVERQGTSTGAVESHSIKIGEMRAALDVTKHRIEWLRRTVRKYS